MVNIEQLFLSKPDFAIKTYIILPHDHLEAVSTEIMRLGALEVITPEKATEYREEVKEIVEYYNLLENAKKLYEELVSHIEEEVTIEIKYDFRPSEFKDLIKRLFDKLKILTNVVEGLNNLIINLRNEIDNFELFRSLVEDIVSKYPEADTSLLKYSGVEIVVETFRGPSEGVSQLQSKALHTISFISKGDKAMATFAFIARDYSKIVESLPKGVEKVETVNTYGLKPLKEVLKEVDNSLESLRNRLADLLAKKRTVIKNNIEDIAILKVVLNLEYERVKAVYEALKSRFTTVLIGWVAQSKINQIEDLAKRYPVQIVFEESSEPPSEFNNLKPFEPFELITEMNGAPSKTDWDPTPLLTYAFALFFGLMIADVGYSIGLILATKYILPFFVEDPKAEGVKKLQRILYTVGFSGIAVGLLSKSFFGDLLGRYIPLQQPIINTMNATQLIVLSLVIGWVWILLSHVLAFIKSVKKLRDVYGALSELSVIAIMLLGTFVILHIMYINKMIERIDFIENNYSTITVLLMISIAVLIFSKIRIAGPLGAILWIFDVVGILGDIFSFIRIAGIALGTAILAYIFNIIIEGTMMINIVLGVIAAIGLHFFAFAISPISPFVHSLRLCMLEISSKFYEGMNRRINALRVRIPSRLTIGGYRRA